MPPVSMATTLLFDGLGRPLGFALCEGQANDLRGAFDLNCDALPHSKGERALRETL